MDQIATPTEEAVSIAFLTVGDAAAAGFSSPAQDYLDGSLGLNAT
ncbi:hypothetical protein [Rathayibacter sp. AY1C5]|nr:hypothetical protein [Rathayibacter sp. AY1C5]